MNINVKRIEKVKEITDYNKIPDGEYDGRWSGYEVFVDIKDKVYKIYVDQGVRGINIPCVVTVRLGTITITEK